MSDSFVHLHLHTEYSFLDGAVRIEELMAKAAKAGMPAVAMTDHGNLFGVIEFQQKAKKHGVKPIIGCEMYLAPGSLEEKKDIPGRKRSSHLTLLAKNLQGYENLVKLVSKAHLDGFYYKPRIDKEHLEIFREGIVCLSGCITGEINQFILADQIDLARESVESFIEIYGEDDFYLEIHDHGLEQQAKCNAQLKEFAKEYGLKLVAANDVHFLNKKDHEAHDVMICIGTNRQVLDDDRMRYSPEVYFKTAKEMRKLFKDFPGACDATLEIAEKCNLELELDATSIERYPQFDSPDGSPREEYFRKLCHEGMVERYGEERANNDAELKTRLDYEIGIMEKMGFLSYFLITWDFIKWAKDNGIPVGPGRGSAAGSLVAYALGITDLCPIRFGLIFERFLNPERVSPPDVDVDFCQSRRGEVIEYVRRKYGETRVSHIITFGTLGAKSVVRDVGRVMGMSYGEGDRIAKMIPTELGITLKDARKKNADLATAIREEDTTGQLWQYATFLEGLTRGAGIHAAGIVIGDRSLDEFVPLTRGNENEVVTQYSMSPLTDLGMLKMDFLGLKTLTVIQDAVDLIHVHTPDFDISKVSLDDGKTFAMLQSGETAAVFQLESGGMASTCKQLGTDRIEDIIALLALYRPGPMDLIPDYIDRKKGKQKIQYLHPLLEEVSEETYGILIYQEQVQKAANLLAGYSLGEADLLRRAMGKKKPEEMAKQRVKFVAGAKETNDIPEKKANEVFDLLEKFAGYGFNKSHSAAYGLVSYQTAFLKANYPVEFMAAVMSNEVNNTDKISFFVAECQRMGMEILPPDVNRSRLKFAPEPGREGEAIRFGLAAIKNVGAAAMATAIAERESGGEYAGLEDFAKRLDSKVVNKKILESLVRAGAFDFTGVARNEVFGRIEPAIAAAQLAQKDRKAGQASLFGDEELEASAAPPPSMEVEVPQWTKEEVLGFEKDLLGFYVTGHPLDAYRRQVQNPKYKTLADLDDLPEGRKKHVFAGLVNAVEVKYTKRESKPFAVFRLEDFTGVTEVIAWNDVYAKKGTLIQDRAVVAIQARIELDSRTESKRLTVENVKALPPDAEVEEQLSSAGTENTMEVHEHRVLDLHLSLEESTEADLEEIREVVTGHPGEVPVRLWMEGADGRRVILRAGDAFCVDTGNGLKEKLSRWIR